MGNMLRGPVTKCNIVYQCRSSTVVCTVRAHVGHASDYALDEKGGFSRLPSFSAVAISQTAPLSAGWPYHLPVSKNA